MCVLSVLLVVVDIVVIGGGGGGGGLLPAPLLLPLAGAVMVIALATAGAADMVYERALR